LANLNELKIGWAWEKKKNQKKYGKKKLYKKLKTILILKIKKNKTETNTYEKNINSHSTLFFTMAPE
jgi:hypothetical protein